MKTFRNMCNPVTISLQLVQGSFLLQYAVKKGQKEDHFEENEVAREKIQQMGR